MTRADMLKRKQRHQHRHALRRRSADNTGYVNYDNSTPRTKLFDFPAPSVDTLPEFFPLPREKSLSDRSRVEVLVQGGGIEFGGVDVLRLRGPVVYLVLRGERPMYVGLSRNGLTRPFSRKHHALDGLGEDDRLQVWPVVSVEAAVELEQLLIQRLLPVWNVRGLHDVPVIAMRLGLSAVQVRRIRRGE